MATPKYNLKYILRFDDRKIAIKYNTITSVLYVGGAKEQDHQIYSIIEVYFGDPTKTIKMIPSNGKIRYSMLLTEKKFNKAIDELKAKLWIYETDSHFRLMR